MKGIFCLNYHSYNDFHSFPKKVCKIIKQSESVQKHYLTDYIYIYTIFAHATKIHANLYLGPSWNETH